VRDRKGRREGRVRKEGRKGKEKGKGNLASRSFLKVGAYESYDHQFI